MTRNYSNVCGDEGSNFSLQASSPAQQSTLLDLIDLPQWFSTFLEYYATIMFMDGEQQNCNFGI